MIKKEITERNKRFHSRVNKIKLREAEEKEEEKQESGTVTYKELNTDVLPVIDVNLYGWDEEINDKDPEDRISLEVIDNAIINLVDKDIQITLEEALKSIKVSNLKMYNPKDYNYEGDEVDFDITFDKAEYEELKEKTLNDKENFEDFLQRGYSSESGFISEMASSIKEFNEEEEWRQVCQVIMYNIPTETIQENNDDFVLNFDSRLDELHDEYYDEEEVEENKEENKEVKKEEKEEEREVTDEEVEKAVAEYFEEEDIKDLMEYSSDADRAIMPTISSVYEDILDKFNIKYNYITTEDVSDGKYLTTIEFANGVVVELDVEAWDDVDIVADNIEEALKIRDSQNKKEENKEDNKEDNKDKDIDKEEKADNKEDKEKKDNKEDSKEDTVEVKVDSEEDAEEDEDAEDTDIINPDDAEYTSQIYKIRVAIDSDKAETKRVYAVSPMEALEIYVAWAEENDKDKLKDAQEFISDEEAKEENYYYVDARQYGASKPYYIKEDFYLQED